jgi:hypothetical protein
LAKFTVTYRTADPDMDTNTETDLDTDTNKGADEDPDKDINNFKGQLTKNKSS